MTDPARRRRVDEICDAALDREAGARAAFVVAACGDDHALRTEVEALLAHAHEAEGFLAAPMGAVVAQVLGEADAPSLIGRQIGAYTILSHLGSGGMGEVYRARDTKLGRDVAIKVLPSSVANDPERLARLTREARTLAALSHPHIATIHGLEDADGVRALVMELVEGPTLADKLAHDSGRTAKAGLPLAEALRIGGQIAEALEAAHEKGIIHRDLKPANIALGHDGHVKVLDFGLARAFSPDGTGRDVSHLPTITAADLQAGAIVGTPAYMSPEQARGQGIDKRTDIWAFGCVLYEMLAGRAAFPGETISDTIAAVLDREPAWGALPAHTPPGIRQLVRRCLDKDSKRRLRDIGDARIEVEEALSTPALDARAATLPSVQTPRWRRALPWAVTGGVAAIAVWMLAPLAPRQAATPTAPLRLTIDLGADVSLATAVGQNVIVGSSLALSPDSAVFAFVAQKTGTGTSQLYVRRLDQLQAMPLAGTEDAASPFFSPDGQWIAFFAQGKLKKVAITGGTTVTLCDAANGRGGSWGEDGTIVFTPSTVQSERYLWRVSSGGGKPEPLPTPADREVTQRWPQILPGGKEVLYTGNTTVAGYEDANLVVQALPAGARKIVQRGGYYGRYLSSGHLTYVHGGTLFAVPFDLTRLEVTGQPVSVLEGVTSNPNTGATQFAVSDTGTIVYLPGRILSAPVPIQLVDRQGQTAPLRATPALWSNPAFAPDGRRLAMEISDGKQSDVWVYEWARDALVRLTFDPADDEDPVWSPDSGRIVFASQRGDGVTKNLYLQRTDGTGEVQRLTESKNRQDPGSWHPSGRFLAFAEAHPQTGADIMILPMSGDEASGWKSGEPTVFLNGSYIEFEPRFSPDGRWLAYQSDESGRPEVYVRPFPGPGGKWQISTDGAQSAIWSRTSDELFFRSLDHRLWVASYTADADLFRAEKPRLWSQARFLPRAQNRVFDLHPDGERFALAGIVEPQTAPKQDKVVFIFNFLDELRRLAPAGQR